MRYDDDDTRVFVLGMLSIGSALLALTFVVFGLTTTALLFVLLGTLGTFATIGLALWTLPK